MGISQPPEKIVLSILLPVRNEGPNLRIMLKMLKAVVEVSNEVIVIYDSPQDTTIPSILELQRQHSNLHAVHNKLGPGVANAITSGVRSAVGEYVLLFAADEVGPVLSIDDMLALLRDGCEFVSCTRYAHGGRRLGGSFIGGILSRTANKLFNVISGSALTDATTGIKMFPRAIFERLELKSKPVGWVVAFEMCIKAQLAGLKLGEVPIISIDRLYGGKSTFRLGPWVIEYFKWFVWGSYRLWKKSGWRREKAMVRAPTLSKGMSG